jgi:hypothetical protein
VLAQLLPHGYRAGVAEAMPRTEQDGWKQDAGKKKSLRRDSTWRTWLNHGEFASQKQRTDEDIWSWPVAERQRKARQCGACPAHALLLLGQRSPQKHNLLQSYLSSLHLIQLYTVGVLKQRDLRRKIALHKHIKCM